MQGAKRVATLGLLLAPALVSLAVSCALDGFNRNDGQRPLPATDGGMDASDASDASDAQDAPINCVHAQFPSQPDVAPGGTLAFVVALRSIDHRKQPDGGPVGIDIDETCSCQGQGPSCVGPQDAGACDLPEGRDNQFAGLLDAIGYGLGTTDVGGYYSQMAEEGHWSMLIRIRDYNGLPDDGRVEVSLFIPHGFGNGDAGPSWTGFDEWPISGNCVGTTDGGDAGDGGFDLEQPRYIDENAFVRDGVLVAGMPEAEFVFGGATTYMKLHATAINLMARIDRTNTGLWSLTGGLLTGILPVRNVFAALGSFRNGEGNPVCTDQVAYDVAKELICTGADLVAAIADPKLACDALSMGIAFVAVEARLGEVVPPEDASTGCAPEVDPTFDQCP